MQQSSTCQQSSNKQKKHCEYISKPIWIWTLEKVVLMLFNVFISQWTISVQMVSFLLPYVFSKYSPQFASPNVFYVMRYHQFRKRQRFLFCLSPYLFSEWHIVPQLCIQIKQSRVHSRKALYEWKASRRLGKQIRGLSRFLSNSTLQQFLSKSHPIAGFCQPTPTAN